MTYVSEFEDIDLAGLTPSLAVPVEVATSEQAIAFERDYLEKRFGAYGVRWQLVFQSLSPSGKRWLDHLHIVVDGQRLCIYFDVTKAIEKQTVTASFRREIC